MTAVDFYILPASDPLQRLMFVCRLTEKAVGSGHRVIIAAGSTDEAEQLDQLLWEFSPESFLPHRQIDARSSTDAHCPVDITASDQYLDHHDVLINLQLEIPACFSRFERYAEVVIQREDILLNSRQHWRFFQHRGYPVKNRRLSDQALTPHH